MSLLPTVEGGGGLAAWLPALAPAWPLVLVLASAVPVARGPAARLAPWAALPALAVAAAAPQASLPLPGLLLGASLQLDHTGRWVLAAVALLWLACGWLAAEWLDRARRMVPFLLAAAGALWLPLTGDLPSALAASVMAAYPLYGLLGGARGGRVLLVSVVIADLLILEALLLLAKAGAGLDFASLRAALDEADGRAALLALLLVGFGAKAGVMGLHYWLPPTLAGASPRWSCAVAAFVPAAGLLPWLRLLPAGEVQWPAAGAVLAWLATAGCAWAVMAGLLQPQARAVTAYALAAVSTLWLGLLGVGLGTPEAGAGAAATAPAAFALSALGAGSLLLAAGASDLHGRLAGWGLAVLSAALIGLAAVAVLVAVLPGAGAAQRLIGSAMACVGLLLGASVSAVARPRRRTPSAPGMLARQTRVSASLVACGVAVALVAGTSLPATLGGFDPWPHTRLSGSVAALLAGFALGLGAVRALAPLPRVPPGDLLGLIEPAVAGLMIAWRRFGAVVGWARDLVQRDVAIVRSRFAGQGSIATAEALLRRWPTAVLLLLALAALAAGLAWVGADAGPSGAPE